jgi:hypothetical protein
MLHRGYGFPPRRSAFATTAFVRGTERPSALAFGDPRLGLELEDQRAFVAIRRSRGSVPAPRVRGDLFALVLMPAFSGIASRGSAPSGGTSARISSSITGTTCSSRLFSGRISTKIPP